MDKNTFLLIENYMKECMCDSAHDAEHVYRVLYTALEIAKTEENVDYDILITACLLHDIGRREQFEDPAVCHAQTGAGKAYAFLRKNGFDERFCENVVHCISTHRFRKNDPPESLEAKILFDADKIDVAGATGIARTLVYKGRVNEPIYNVLPNGDVSDGTNDTEPSFFQEYKYKLEKLYNKFFTAEGMKIAKSRQAAAVDYYKAIYDEVSMSYHTGRQLLEEYGLKTEGKICDGQ